MKASCIERTCRNRVDETSHLEAYTGSNHLHSYPFFRVAVFMVTLSAHVSLLLPQFHYHSILLSSHAFHFSLERDRGTVLKSALSKYE